VKSKASSVQPIQAAQYAYHWSLVGSFHHGTSATFLAYPDIDFDSLMVSRLYWMGLFYPIPSATYQ
jgi:hypothetical protein